MDLVIIRHAIAEDRIKFARSGRPDAERPLTAEGRRKFKRSLKGLRRASPKVSVIATSPYARAAETCRLAMRVFPKARVVTLPALRHRGDNRLVIRWLAGQPRGAAAGIVGHEPDLSRLTALLLGSGAPPVAYKKGGAALITFAGRAAAGVGTLEWLLTPALLRRLK